MAKKYRYKDLKNIAVIVHTENGPDPKYPVVYSFAYPEVPDQWLPSYTHPLSHENCNIEEVPEEPIGVGYSWTKNGRLYKVVYEALTEKAYLVVTEGKDQTQILASVRVNHWHTEYWWKESDIRQASET